MKYFDGVGHSTTTAGTGTITLGAAIDSSYFTFAEQGAVSTDQVYYRIDEGGDVEIGIGTLGTSAGTLTRDTVLKSRIGGTAGTTKMTLGGAAEVLCVAPSVVFKDIVDLTAADPLDGSELLKIVQSGNNRKVTALEVAQLASANLGLFIKADPYSVAITKTGNGTASIKAGTIIEVDGTIFTYSTDTAITMPTLAAGNDIAVWIKPDGTPEGTLDHSSPPVADSRLIGGLHYAPGGNAAAQAGGNTTAQFNEYSIWDLKFRPACQNPRGMTLVAGAFWVDIYLLGVNHHTDGTSRYNVTIADGSSPPKVPSAFGGNGSTAYSTLTWWEANEVLASHGKSPLSYEEFAAATYGTTENSSGSTDPVSTILRQAYTSKWGVMLATGNLYVWGNMFGGGAASAAWANTNGGRGQVYQQPNAALLGGAWADTVYSGSRASVWLYLPSSTDNRFSARGRCDHVCLL